MDYTSIHIYGHILSDDVLHQIENDTAMQGNREQDFNLGVPVKTMIDNAWSSLRNDWSLFAERSPLNDPYGTSAVRRMMVRFLSSLDYQLDYHKSQVEANSRYFNITYTCPTLSDLPVIIVGDKSGIAKLDTLDKCTLDIRVKGEARQKSPHATMLDYLNNTENVYGIVTNGIVLRLIRNTGQLVKLTYIEFDIRRMLEEDHYSEFCLMFRLLHASRFSKNGDDACIMEQWFNLSVDSGNRIRSGLSEAVRQTMETIGNAVVTGDGEGNEAFRQAFLNGEASELTLNKELIHLVYRLLFLFIIEDRHLVYDRRDDDDINRRQDIYRRYYAVSRLRGLSEKKYLYDKRYHDLWEGLIDSFRLFEDETFGSPLYINPLGGKLFAPDTLQYLRRCRITNEQLLRAFSFINEFQDEGGNWVKINYSSLDVEEFGSVYEGILEMRAVVVKGTTASGWRFTFGAGQDRKSSSSYYTRPDLVQSIIRTTLEPVIKERMAKQPDTGAKIKDLLSMRLCDAACGSGHIVLAMARTLAWYICSLRTGEDNPASADYRQALREVIQHCVYAVDSNPDAVELCKVVLWIEGYCAGKPLSFLDHHVRCGNSVVGVTTLDTVLRGVPKGAFDADNKTTLKTIREMNDRAVKFGVANTSAVYDDAGSLPFEYELNVAKIGEEQIGLAKDVEKINAMPEETIYQCEKKQKAWETLEHSARMDCLKRACDIYTYAFFKRFTADDLHNTFGDLFGEENKSIPYTQTLIDALKEMDDGKHILPDTFKREVDNVAEKYRFFHWCLEFPDIFAIDKGNRGFDVMCGNPPWDKIKVEDKKWFERQGRTDIVKAGNAAIRERAIAALQNTDPKLYADYHAALANAEGMSRFIRFSGRFTLTATGDINLFPLFAEHCLNCSTEAWGLVLPTGIAVNDSSKQFFAKLVDENRLVSLYDFENREKLFDIDSRFKFCLLTVGKPQSEPRGMSAGFFLTRIDHLLDPARIYKLTTADFSRFNPNTKTCPIFRTSRDAELTAKIYRNMAILVNDATGDNPWGIRFASMFHMSNDSHLFRTFAQLTAQGAQLRGNHFFCTDGREYVPLYEGKMFNIYNPHFAEWPTTGERPSAIDSIPSEKLADPDYAPMPWYWVPKSEADNTLVKTDAKKQILWEWKHKWFIVFRDVTNATNERTFVVSIMPDTVGVGHSAALLYPECGAMPGALLLSMMSSMIFDYSTRQKIGGNHASITFVKQFPVLAPSQFPAWSKPLIVERVAELCYFNHALDGWMDELWHDDEMTDDIRRLLLRRLADCNGVSIDSGSATPELSSMQPYAYNEQRRAVAQAELDAIYARLYGLTTAELRYVLDPEDVCGKGCINQTFRVLKERETNELGEYRTKRLVLEAWKRFGFDTQVEAPEKSSQIGTQCERL